MALLPEKRLVPLVVLTVIHLLAVGATLLAAWYANYMVPDKSSMAGLQYLGPFLLFAFTALIFALLVVGYIFVLLIKTRGKLIFIIYSFICLLLVSPTFYLFIAWCIKNREMIGL